MHENLKYTLKLSDKIKEHKSFKNKDPKNKEDRAEISDWQAIFAGNNYDTHYLIYTKFLGKKSNNTFKVSKIQFYIQNYSGDVVMGFANHNTIEQLTISKKDPDWDPRFPNRKKIKVGLAVQGFRANKNTYSFKPKNLVLTTNDIIMTDVLVVPVDSKISKIYHPKERRNSNFVDSLFMGRMGSNVFVTEAGKDELFRIHLLNNKLVTKDNLNQVGINIKLFAKSKLKKIRSDYSHDDTPKYPCIPIYSICEVQ